MKYIILTGHRKSGTTMLHKLFDGHPELNIYPVDISLLYAFYPYWTSKLTDESELRDRFSLVVKNSTAEIEGRAISKKICSFNSNNFLKVIFSNYSPADLKRPAQLVDAIGHSYCEYAGLDENLPFLLKETSQIINRKSFTDDGLDFQMVQLIRDPRDNYAAIKAGVNSYYSEIGENQLESLASVVNRARIDLEIANIIAEQKSTGFHAYRFEDLTANTLPTISSIASDLNLSWHKCLSYPTLLGQSYSGNNHSGHKFTGVSSVNVGRWKDRITKQEACVIEAWMGATMKHWNYCLAFNTEDHLQALSDFYSWYNSKYFYADSFR